MLAKILGPSECGAHYRSITYECSGIVVTHDCAPYSTDVSPLSVNTPTAHPSSLTVNWMKRRQPMKKVQLKLDAFVHPPSPPFVDEPKAVQLTGVSSQSDGFPAPPGNTTNP